GMLIGEGDGVTAAYIKTVPTRVQAAVLVLRLRGLEEEAKAYAGTDNFADADAEWSKNILAYIKAHPEYGMIGVGDNRFDPKAEINAQQYAKILLEALGYQYNVDFTWEETRAKAESVGLSVQNDGRFTVEALSDATVSALSLPVKDGSMTLLGSVITQREGIRDDEYLANPQKLPAELKAAHLETRHKARGLVYNDDGNDTYVEYDNYPGDFDPSTVTEPMTHETFLSKRTAGVEDSQVTTIMYCDGVFNSYHHRTSGETTVRKRDWSFTLADTEMDSLETKIDFGNQHGIEVFWSMRMNDCHDASYQENELDPWKQEHLDWLFGRKNTAVMELRYGAHYWSAVDYGVPEVRQKVYNILKDTVTRYDVDGIQLDFSRYPIYFKQVAKTGEVLPESIERMNNLIRSVRTMMDQVSIERNKPLMLAIYVPDSIDFCTALGLDIKSWMEEDLIDMAGIRTTVAIQSWEDSVAEYSPYDVQIHATFDTYLAMEKNSSPDFNKEAALAYRAGVDGIQLYNNFNPRSSLFDTLGSPETCGAVDPSYKSLFKRTGNYGMQVKNPERFMKPIPYSTN
ncbi:MAG: family 10 glycosylhydrolase, partial [Clostridia bacterium]